MFIFTLSITPVTFVHNLFAHHRDVKIVHNHTKTSEIAIAGINCNTENFVGENNFILSYSPLLLLTAFIPSLYLDGYTRSFYSQHHFFAELRGPPSNLLI
jgi:nitrogenase subunit NifH